VRHANDQDLDHLEGLLEQLRRFAPLHERKRGYFSLRSRAFVHFHEDAADFYVDVRLDGEFQRMRVTSEGEQAAFLRRVRAALPPDH